MVGVDPDSEGLARAREPRVSASRTRGSTGSWPRTSCPTSSSRPPRPTCTGATPPATRKPASGPSTSPRPPSGPFVIPPVNLTEHLDAPERQHGHLRRPGHHPDGATPCRRVADVPYAEIVATVASARPVRGPGRTSTSSPGRPRGRRGARRGRPGQGHHHPQPGRSAAHHARHHLLLPSPTRPTRTRSADSIDQMVAEVQTYVPGYRLRRRPQFDEDDGTGGWPSSSRSRAPATSCRPTPATSTS